jgi:hypothetical protein
MSGRRHRALRKTPRGAVLAFLALALQVLLPFFVAAEIAHANAHGDAAIICSALGPGAHEANGTTGDRHGIAASCPICTALAAGQGFAPPPAPPLPLPTALGHSVVAVADTSARAALIPSAYRSRAPPSIA